MVAIQDPIHGTIEVSRREIKLIDSQAFQRLRHIKQLGFSELAFPGATHSRYAHSLGAMHMATRMADRVLGSINLADYERERLRQSVRLAMLFHDLGHPPMSHVSERVMPKVSELGIGSLAGGAERQATHEDYTVKLLIDSELTALIDEHFGDDGHSGARLASIIAGTPPPGDEAAFLVDGVDFLGLLHQMVSSEMDADRMDYLRRDAYYCGVSYGNFDHQWLTNALTAVPHEGSYALGLLHKGVWAFENFLLARLHMFLAVYYHHTSTCFDHLLGRFYNEGGYRLPADSAGYLGTDDVQLLSALRASKSPWAEHIVRRHAYRLLLETHDFGEDAKDQAVDSRLEEAKIDFFRLRSRGVLSKYFKRRDEVMPLFVVEPEMQRVSRIEDYTPLYKRFNDVVAVSRVFCRPEQLEQARRLLAV
jgi:uncharacterized protein